MLILLKKLKSRLDSPTFPLSLRYIPIKTAIMAKNHGKQIKDDAKYEALRKEGMGKTKAARIANTPDSGKKGGKAKTYEERSKAELYEQAKKVGIPGRSKMNKEELIKALRSDKQ